MANQLAQMKTKSKGLSSKIIGFENVLSCQLNGVLIFCYIALHSQKTQPTIEADVYVPRHFGCLSIHVCWFIVLHSLGGFSIPQFIRLHSVFSSSLFTAKQLVAVFHEKLVAFQDSFRMSLARCSSG